MMKNNASFIFFLSVILSANCFSQGLNHIFLLGYDTALFDTNVTSAKARLLFNSNSLTIAPESLKMAIDGTQANISDPNGNLLISSNGCWIVNATGDTMFNRSGLNPGTFTDDRNNVISGLPIPHGNIFLPFPGDSSKYILFHQTGNYNANLLSTELYYSPIDMTLDSGKGGVALKNQVLMQKKLSWGIAACKHENGRVWWIVVLKDSSFNVKELLLTPQGILSITTLTLGSIGPTDPVAINDEYYSPYLPFQTNFLYTYQAANGLIYISCGNGVIDFHCINSPDCGAMASNVQLNSIHLPCFSFRSNVNHPNYYLGPVIGSACDSLVHVGIEEDFFHDFHFTVSPNPSIGNFRISYLLPEGKSGTFILFYLVGNPFIEMTLPRWSSTYQFYVSEFDSGLSLGILTSTHQTAIHKIAIIN